MRLEDQQRKPADVPYCCERSITWAKATGDAFLLAGFECNQCAAFWLEVAPGRYIMEPMMNFA